MKCGRFFLGVLLFFFCTSKKCSKINSEQVEREGRKRRLEDQGSDGTSNGQGSSRAGLEGTSVVGLGGGSGGGGGDGRLGGSGGSVNGSGGQAGGGGSRSTSGGDVGGGGGHGIVLNGEESRVGQVGGVGDQDRVEAASGDGGRDLDSERTGLGAVQVTEGGNTSNGGLDTVSTLDLEHDGEGGVGEASAGVGPGDGGILTSRPGGGGDGGTVFEELGRGDGGDGRGGDGEDGGGLHVCVRRRGRVGVWFVVVGRG